MTLLVYALVADAQPPLGRGIAGDALRLAEVGGFRAVVGAPRRVPSAVPATLAAYDGVQKRIARRAAATLPMRFGTTAAGEDELARTLAPAAGAVRRALALVRNREQMTLRIIGTPGGPGVLPTRARRPRSGTDYMRRRRDALAMAEAVPEIAPLRAALAPLVRDERRERHDRPPLIASVHHLIDRGGAAAYRAALRNARHAPTGHRVLVRGPWPPYAFAAGLALGDP